MRRLFAIGAVVLCGHIAGASYAQASDNVDQAWVTQNLTSGPLAFTQNIGQWDDRALFRANAGGATMWFTAAGAIDQFSWGIEWLDGSTSDSSVMGGKRPSLPQPLCAHDRTNKTSLLVCLPLKQELDSICI